jgi:glycosyltransferase involved in cell wall biosynthesis
MHALIICTKNRNRDLQSLIDNLSDLRPKFDEIIIIDSSRYEDRIVIKHEIEDVSIHYLDVGLSAARNIGLSIVSERAKFVHFLDDDVTLEPDYLLQVNIFFNNYPDAQGVTGNDLNLTSNKSFKIILLKLYLLLISKQGKFTKFGFNFGNYWNFGTYLVDWLPGCNMVIKHEIAKKYSFKETFNPTFCEDLVYGLDLSAQHNLYFCSNIKYRHNLSPVNRLNRSKRRQSTYHNLNYLFINYGSSLNIFGIRTRILLIKILLRITMIIEKSAYERK